jgi:1-deoxy-D-xylulose-5-phosphate reductoisomerase
MRQGGLVPSVLNGANEVAVAAFLERRIGFTDIASLVGDVLELDVQNTVSSDAVPSLEAIFEADAQARQKALNWLERAA